MIHYQFDSSVITLSEQRNGNDYEFRIKVTTDEQHQSMQQIRSHFDHNDVHTDVLFYTHLDHGYQVIVREDYYVDFLLQLFKYRLLTNLAWT